MLDCAANHRQLSNQDWTTPTQTSTRSVKVVRTGLIIEIVAAAEVCHVAHPDQATAASARYHALS